MSISYKGEMINNILLSLCGYKLVYRKPTHTDRSVFSADLLSIVWLPYTFIVGLILMTVRENTINVVTNSAQAMPTQQLFALGEPYRCSDTTPHTRQEGTAYDQARSIVKEEWNLKQEEAHLTGTLRENGYTLIIHLISIDNRNTHQTRQQRITRH